MTGRVQIASQPPSTGSVCPVTMLDAKRGVILTRRESNDEPPNYFEREIKSAKLSQLTTFPHPTPDLLGIQKELLRYELR